VQGPAGCSIHRRTAREITRRKTSVAVGVAAGLDRGALRSRALPHAARPNSRNRRRQAKGPAKRESPQRLGGACRALRPQYHHCSAGRVARVTPGGSERTLRRVTTVTEQNAMGEIHESENDSETIFSLPIGALSDIGMGR
jgi:hypothetical protein